MCYSKFTASKFVAISIFMKKKWKIAFSLKFITLCKKKIYYPAITPPKQMQTLSLYWL